MAWRHSLIRPTAERAELVESPFAPFSALVRVPKASSFRRSPPVGEDLLLRGRENHGYRFRPQELSYNSLPASKKGSGRQGTTGFGSGLYAYAKRRLIDYPLAGTLLIVTIPMALVGT